MCQAVSYPYRRSDRKAAGSLGSPPTRGLVFTRDCQSAVLPERYRVARQHAVRRFFFQSFASCCEERSPADRNLSFLGGDRRYASQQQARPEACTHTAYQLNGGLRCLPTVDCSRLGTRRLSLNHESLIHTGNILWRFDLSSM